MLWSKKKKQTVAMAGCFPDLHRQRTHSFDLHLLAGGSKLSKLGKIFRSKSDSDVKTRSTSVSPKGSPKSSPGAPSRRRFMRVVRNTESVGEEYSNPHIIRKYDPGAWEREHMNRSRSLDDPCRRELPLPYTVTGPTILKKGSSLDSDASIASNASMASRHAFFKEEVEVMTFDRKGKCLTILDESYIQKEKLHDSDEDLSDSSDLTLEERETRSQHRIERAIRKAYEKETEILTCFDESLSCIDETVECDKCVDSEHSEESIPECTCDEEDEVDSKLDSVASRLSIMEYSVSHRTEIIGSQSSLSSSSSEDEGKSAPKVAKLCSGTLCKVEEAPTSGGHLQGKGGAESEQVLLDESSSTDDVFNVES